VSGAFSPPFLALKLHIYLISSHITYKFIRQLKSKKKSPFRNL